MAWQNYNRENRIFERYIKNNFKVKKLRDYNKNSVERLEPEIKWEKKTKN